MLLQHCATYKRESTFLTKVASDVFLEPLEGVRCFLLLIQALVQLGQKSLGRKEGGQEGGREGFSFLNYIICCPGHNWTISGAQGVEEGLGEASRRMLSQGELS